MADFTADGLHELRSKAEALLNSAREGDSVMARTYAPPGLNDGELVVFWEEQLAWLEKCCKDRDTYVYRNERGY